MCIKGADEHCGPLAPMWETIKKLWGINLRLWHLFIILIERLGFNNDQVTFEKPVDRRHRIISSIDVAVWPLVTYSNYFLP